MGFDLFDLPGGLDHPALQLYESLTPRKEGCKLEGWHPEISQENLALTARLGSSAMEGDLVRWGTLTASSSPTDRRGTRRVERRRRAALFGIGRPQRLNERSLELGNDGTGSARSLPGPDKARSTFSTSASRPASADFLGKKRPVNISNR